MRSARTARAALRRMHRAAKSSNAPATYMGGQVGAGDPFGKVNFGSGDALPDNISRFYNSVLRCMSQVERAQSSALTPGFAKWEGKITDKKAVAALKAEFEAESKQIGRNAAEYPTSFKELERTVGPYLDSMDTINPFLQKVRREAQRAFEEAQEEKFTILGYTEEDWNERFPETEVEETRARLNSCLKVMPEYVNDMVANDYEGMADSFRRGKPQEIKNVAECPHFYVWNGVDLLQQEQDLLNMFSSLFNDEEHKASVLEAGPTEYFGKAPVDRWYTYVSPAYESFFFDKNASGRMFHEDEHAQIDQVKNPSRHVWAGQPDDCKIVI